MKTKEQFLQDYLDGHFELKDILRESDYKRYIQLAEMDSQKEILRKHRK